MGARRSPRPRPLAPETLGGHAWRESGLGARRHRSSPGPPETIAPPRSDPGRIHAQIDQVARRKLRKKCCWLTIPLIRPAISSSCRADPSDTVSSLPPAGYSTDRVSRLTRTSACMQGRDSNQHARQTSRQSLGHRAGYRPCRRGHAVPTGSPQPSLVDAPCQVGHRAFFFSSLTPTECGEPAGVGRPAPLSSVQPLFPSTSVGPGYVPTASRGRYRLLPRRALRPALARGASALPRHSTGRIKRPARQAVRRSDHNAHERNTPHLHGA